MYAKELLFDFMNELKLLVSSCSSVFLQRLVDSKKLRLTLLTRDE